MIKSRIGVFETNSSSSHSISICHGQLTDTLGVDENGVCEIYPGEFGREVVEYNDAAEKASYCLTYAKCLGEDKDYPEMLAQVIKKHLGCKEVQLCAMQDGSWGYIDHQSFDVCAEAFESEESLIDFIFCQESELKTDNDNH